MEPIGEVSRFSTRMAGFFWFMTAVTGTFAMMARLRQGRRRRQPGGHSSQPPRARIPVSVRNRNPTSSPAACYIAATLLVYDLLKPVNRNLSLLAAFFSLMGCAGAVVSFAFRLAHSWCLETRPTRRIHSAVSYRRWRSRFSDCVHRPATSALRFSGLHCLLVGCLILGSTFLPRIVGALMVCAGLWAG